MTTRKHVSLSIRDHVARLTLRRPERRNAMTRAMVRQMVEDLHRVTTDADVWALVVTGEGTKAFCAGADLHEWRADPPRSAAPRPMTGTDRNLYEALLETPKPTVAAINGWAAGGGLELALACDLRIAAAHAQLVVPEAKRGMGANFASVVLPRLLPPAIALELLYTAEPIAAPDALRWGLVNDVVPAERLDAAVDEMVSRIVANAPMSLRRYKETFVKGHSLPLSLALRLDAGPDPYSSDDRQEGVRAFFEKRAPRWKNR